MSQNISAAVAQSNPMISYANHWISILEEAGILKNLIPTIIEYIHPSDYWKQRLVPFSKEFNVIMHHSVAVALQRSCLNQVTLEKAKEVVSRFIVIPTHNQCVLTADLTDEPDNEGSIMTTNPKKLNFLGPLNENALAILNRQSDGKRGYLAIGEDDQMTFTLLDCCIPLTHHFILTSTIYQGFIVRNPKDQSLVYNYLEAIIKSDSFFGHLNKGAVCVSVSVIANTFQSDQPIGGCPLNWLPPPKSSVTIEELPPEFATTNSSKS